MAELFLKDPGATLDYRIEWENSLFSGVSINQCEWSVLPLEEGGVEVESSGIEGFYTTVRLSGGVPGHLYSVTARVLVSDGSIDERSMIVRVEER